MELLLKLSRARVARQFFRIGGASGTIAKTISTYDKTFSDNIYSEEDDKRYVTESRVDKMLDHEIDLLETRIRKNYPQNVFTYANTVATIDFAKKFKGHGWMGIRFQTHPKEQQLNHIHIRFHQSEARLQQEVLGIMGSTLYTVHFKIVNLKSC